MIRRILIPLDSSPYTDSALEYGCHIAAGQNAELTGLAVLDVPGIEKSIGSVPAGGIQFADNLVKAKMQDAMDHIAELIAKFEAVCKKNNVAYRAAKCQGSPSTEIIHESIYYDRVIIGMRTFFKVSSDDEGDSIEKILDSTITPIIAVPKILPELKPDSKFKVLITFDDSLPAARSIHRFAEIAQKEKYIVKVVMSDKDELQSRVALEKIQEFLKAHGFTDIKTEWTSQPITDAVKERYLDWADGIVLGMHSKRGLVDFMIGSLSRFLIRNESKLLLLGQ